MKTPSFWQSRNPLSTLLMPFSALYRLGTLVRNQISGAPMTVPVPVICVGNLIAGGAGKTPLALSIGQLLKQKHVNAFYLSRGYGGRLAGPVRVNPLVHSAREVGDEPLLLAQILPTIVAKDRYQGAVLALQYGAETIVMDDGFQNPKLTKTLSLLVIDGNYGFGNGRLIPAGPLREPPHEGFARADAVVVVNASSRLPKIPPGIPVLRAAALPTPAAHALKGKRVLAFSGIAFPERFFRTLETLEAIVVEAVPFPDHHLYTRHDMERLSRHARALQATLVTTAKDAARLTPDWKSLVTVVEITFQFEQPEAMEALLDKALKHA